MKIKRVLFFTFLSIAVLKVHLLNAQMCGSGNLSINQLLNEAELIVSGKIIDQHSFWNKAKSEIYTKHTIEISQSSNFSSEKVYVITEGGTVNDVTYKVFGTPGFDVFEEGLFFLSSTGKYKANKTEGNYFHLIDVASFNEAANTIENNSSIIAVENFNAILNAKYQATFSFALKNQKKYKVKQPTITDINPKTVAAGTNDILVISGSNFGNYSGSAKVAMRSASSLNASAFFDIKASNIISWTDTEIELIVPGDEFTDSAAGVGSGKIQLTNEFGTTITSAQTVEVKYNKKVYNNTSIALRSKNNNGKIEVYVERELVEDGALPAIKNTINKWNCATSSALVYAGIVDGVCAKYDGLTVICYDAAIPASSLGKTRVISRNCTSTGFADMLDADITINPNIDWAFNDTLSFSQYHFESVMLHEVGHAFMLGHVLNDSDIMYPILYNSIIKNELTENDVAGGLDVMNTSIVENDCSSFGAMIPNNNAEECNACTNLPEISMKNLTENSVYLSWAPIEETATYQIQYRYQGMNWHNYECPTSYAILFDLQPCATVEWKLMSSCNNNNNALRETVYRFATAGCP